MHDLNLRTLHPPGEEQFPGLIEASVKEGYSFVQKLWDEYQSGVNRFDELGAVLLGGYLGTRLVAVGGVHPDSYLKQPEIGRIRHVYVLPDQRRTGVGRMLMWALIEHSRQHFDYLTLRTLTTHGDAFYTSLGFNTTPRFNEATHWLKLAVEDQ